MTAVSSGSSQQAVVEAALVLLERMGLSPADLTALPQSVKHAHGSRQCRRGDPVGQAVLSFLVA